MDTRSSTAHSACSRHRVEGRVCFVHCLLSKLLTLSPECGGCFANLCPLGVPLLQSEDLSCPALHWWAQFLAIVPSGVQLVPWGSWQHDVPNFTLGVLSARLGTRTQLPGQTPLPTQHGLTDPVI